MVNLFEGVTNQNCALLRFVNVLEISNELRPGMCHGSKLTGDLAQTLLNQAMVDVRLNLSDQCIQSTRVVPGILKVAVVERQLHVDAPTCFNGSAGRMS